MPLDFIKKNLKNVPRAFEFFTMLRKTEDPFYALIKLIFSKTEDISKTTSYQKRTS